MLPAASVSGVAVKTIQPATALSGDRTSQPQAPETARASVGEGSAANVRAESTKAVTAPEQTAVAPRLRDQETAERTERTPPAKDTPTGPPPTFEESPLERQARVAFDPPDPATATDTPPPETDANTGEGNVPPSAISSAPQPAEPPPTKSERAETSFAETKTLAEQREPATVDVAR